MMDSPTLIYLWRNHLTIYGPIDKGQAGHWWIIITVHPTLFDAVIIYCTYSQIKLVPLILQT